MNIRQKKNLHVTEVFEGGPDELGGIVAMLILVDRLLVKLINDPFDIPIWCSLANKKIFFS